MLDLKIQIATIEGDFSEAERLIGLLRAQPDDGGRSVKRDAIIALRRDQNPARAVAILDHGISAGLGGMLDLRAVRCIALARMTGAETRAREDAEYVASRPAGIQIAHRLEAHLSLSKQNWRAALASLAKVESKNASDRLLEARILEAKSEDVKLPLTERTEAHSQALVLRRQFGLATEFDIV